MDGYHHLGGYEDVVKDMFSMIVKRYRAILRSIAPMMQIDRGSISFLHGQAFRQVAQSQVVSPKHKYMQH